MALYDFIYESIWQNRKWRPSDVSSQHVSSLPSQFTSTVSLLQSLLPALAFLAFFFYYRFNYRIILTFGRTLSVDGRYSNGIFSDNAEIKALSSKDFEFFFCGRDCGTMSFASASRHITPPLGFEPGWMTAAFLLLTPQSTRPPGRHQTLLCNRIQQNVDQTLRCINQTRHFKFLTRTMQYVHVRTHVQCHLL